MEKLKTSPKRNVRQRPKPVAASPKKVGAPELMGLIKEERLEGICRALGSDKWVIKLGTVTVFKLLLCSILEGGRASLRTMADYYISPPFQVLEQSATGNRTAHSSLRDRLVRIDARFFRRVYEDLMGELAGRYGAKQPADRHIRRYDSTMVSVFSHLMQAMRVGNTSRKKNQAKFTTEMTDGFGLDMRFFSDQGHLSEETALKEMILSKDHGPDTLVIFDRGLKSRAAFVEMKEKGIKFITRLTEKARFTVLREHAPAPTGLCGTLKVLSDSIVHLYGDRGKKVPEEFRMIRAECTETGNVLVFLTTVTDMAAADIAAAYLMRWDIEVLFRFLKQEMNLTHFVCNKANAIEVMIYCTLIAAMLILLYKKLNGISSYKMARSRFFKELEASILLGVLNDPDGPERLKEALAAYIARAS